MDTSIKRLLEVAGVDISKGKAKELCEANTTGTTSANMNESSELSDMFNDDDFDGKHYVKNQAKYKSFTKKVYSAIEDIKRKYDQGADLFLSVVRMDDFDSKDSQTREADKVVRRIIKLEDDLKELIKDQHLLDIEYTVQEIEKAYKKLEFIADQWDND